MHTLSIILVLISAALHAGWNTVLKQQSDTSSSAIVLAFYACLFALVAGFPNLSSALTPQAILYTAGAGLFAGGALAAIGLAFRGGSLALTYTISRGGSILLLWPISHYFLGEIVTAPALLGAVILTIALCGIMLRGKHEQTNKHLWWAFVSALCVVGYHIFYKRALIEGVNHFALLGLSDILRVIISFLLLDGNRWSRVVKASKENLRVHLFMALMSFLSFSTFLFALKTEGAAHLGTLRNLSVLFTAIGASRIGEKITHTSAALIVLAMLGSILVGWK